MKDIQEMINKKSDDKTEKELELLLIKCLELIDGTRTGSNITMDINGVDMKVNSSAIFKRCFKAIEPIVKEKNRERDSREFVNQVGQLKGQLNDLLGENYDY